MLRYITIITLLFNVTLSFSQSTQEALLPADRIQLGIPAQVDGNPAFTEFFEQLHTQSSALERAITDLQRDLEAIDELSEQILDSQLHKRRARYLEEMIMYKEMLATNTRILNGQLALQAVDEMGEP